MLRSNQKFKGIRVVITHFILLVFTFIPFKLFISMYKAIINDLSILTEIDNTYSIPIDTAGQDKDIIKSLEWWYLFGGINMNLLTLIYG